MRTVPGAGGGGPRPTRRGLLAGSVVLVTASATACDLLATDPAGEGSGSRRQAAGPQAPALARQVRDGTLPELSERLPRTPLVVEPVERAGLYGHEIRSVILGPAEAIQLYRLVGYEGLVRWTPDWTDEVVPNIAESFEVSSDAREYVFTLRAGMRWSDGRPFTADDVVFAQNEILNHRDLYPGEPLNPVVAEKLDDHVVRLRFEQPNSLFLQQQATTSGAALVTKPMHYLRDFHADHNPDVADVSERENQADWMALLLAKTDQWANPDLPTLNPWMLTNAVGDGSQVALDRNPYYWKVDPDGRQLPYIDRVVYDIVADAEVTLTRVLNGDVDHQLRPVNTLANKPVLARNADAGQYRLYDAVPSNMNTMALSLNLTHRDPVLRDIFRAKDFRIGLSHAINRQEIVDTVYQRQGEPYQCAPRPEFPLYDEKLAKQYTEFDPDLAARHLDRVLPDKDGAGFRLRPDGRRLTFAVEFSLGIWPDYPNVLELVRDYWAAVGVHMQIKGEDRSLFETRVVGGNEHDAAAWQGDGGMTDLYLEPRYYAPCSTAGSFYAFPWAQWYVSGGESGEEPPAAARRQLDLYDQLKAAVDSDERASLMARILRIAQEEFYLLGISLQPMEYGVVTRRLRNVPDSMPNSWVYPTPGPTNPEQYFVEAD